MLPPLPLRQWVLSVPKRLRYCARPPFALDHLHQHDAEHLLYDLPKHHAPLRVARAQSWVRADGDARTIADAGHRAQHDQPEQVAALLAEFLTR